MSFDTQSSKLVIVRKVDGSQLTEAVNAFNAAAHGGRLKAWEGLDIIHAKIGYDQRNLERKMARKVTYEAINAAKSRPIDVEPGNLFITWAKNHRRIHKVTLPIHGEGSIAIDTERQYFRNIEGQPGCMRLPDAPLSVGIGRLVIDDRVAFDEVYPDALTDMQASVPRPFKIGPLDVY